MLACELPATLGVTLARLGTADIAREVRRAGIAPFDRPVAQVLSHREARGVFRVMDKGFSYHGEASVQRLQMAFPSIVPVHGPTHPSWRHQSEIHCLIFQRKALTLHDFGSVTAIEDRFVGFDR